MHHGQILVLLLLALVASSALGSRPFFQSIWNSWKEVNRKTYATRREEKLRRRIFINNYMFVRWHNQRYYLGQETYSTTLNQFADLTVKEFSEKYNKLKTDEMSKFWESLDYAEESIYDPAPDAIDWRKQGLVTPVKDQGQCGSCWAFSATGSLEGQLKKAKGRLISLSEQQLVDCSRREGNEGCNGGLMNNAFQYWMHNGAESEADYPYRAIDSRCRFNRSKVVSSVSAYVRIPNRNEEQLRVIVGTVGPVSVAIDASSPGFQFYRQGIYYDQLCSDDTLDHGVLVVGYDADENNKKYWIVKNSWSNKWGMNGYILMARDRQNMCGIATMASYPIV